MFSENHDSYSYPKPLRERVARRLASVALSAIAIGTLGTPFATLYDSYKSDAYKAPVAAVALGSVHHEQNIEKGVYITGSTPVDSHNHSRPVNDTGSDRILEHYGDADESSGGDTEGQVAPKSDEIQLPENPDAGGAVVPQAGANSIPM